MRYLYFFIGMLFVSMAIYAQGPNGGMRIPRGNYREPLTKFTNFTTATNRQPVSAGSELYDGWNDLAGNTFSITNGGLAVVLSNTHRTNMLSRAVSEAKIDQTIVAEFTYQGGRFTTLWPRFNSGQKGGARVYVNTNTNSFTAGMCTNAVLFQQGPDAMFSGGVLTNGSQVVMIARAKPAGSLLSAGTMITGEFWLKTDWQSLPQGTAQATFTHTVTNSPTDGLNNPVALTGSIINGLFNKVQNLWVYDNTATATLPAIPLGSNSVNIAYLGSSTWVMGSPTVPYRIATNLFTSYPGSTINTINGAVGGSTTTTWLPGSVNNLALKALVQAASGRKILRVMIGSNDASNNVAVGTWQTNMQSIVNDAWTWPVDKIIVEEIGVRLDGGSTTLNLIKSYNDTRNVLYGVQLGNSRTFNDQSTHLNLLDVDNVHQTTAGMVRLGQLQAAEVTLP